MCQRLSHSMLASVVLLALVCMQTPCIAQWGDPSAADKKILAALDSPTVCEFKDTSLEDIVEELQKRHGVKMRIDTKALDDCGLSLNEPITFSIKDVSLRSALRTMLADLDLTYVIADGLLVITLQDYSDMYVSTRVYPVDDLIGSDSADKAIRNCGRLIEVIQSVVLPNCWVEVGGTGSITPIPPGNPRSLVVAARQGTHELIPEVLDCLRRANSAKPDDIPVSIRRPLRPREKKVAAALRSSASVDFKKTPLREVLGFLEKQHGITIRADKKALYGQGVNLDTPISLRIEDVSLLTVLRIMLRDLYLTCLVKHEILLITTDYEHHWQLELRVYPLVNVMPQPRRKLKVRNRYVDELIDTITTSIEPNSWDLVGGTGSIQPLLLEKFDVLVILQTPEIHKQIAGILSRKEFRHSKWVRQKDAPPWIPGGGTGGGGMGMF